MIKFAFLTLAILISSFLPAAAGEPRKPRFRPDRVIIVPKKNVPPGQLRDFHLQRGRRSLKKFPSLAGIQVLELAPGESVGEAIGQLRRSGLVEIAEPDYILTAQAVPNDPEFVNGTQWGLRNTGQNGGTSGADINAVTAWDTLRHASNIVVAVVDSGIRHTHEDLAANMWVNPGEIPGNGRDDDANGIVDDVHGINAISNSGNPMDDNGHGTHVAGIIGAVANNGKGVSGVAWGVRLMGCKFLDGAGDGDTSDAIQAIDYARRNGAHIINASFGGDQYSSALFTALASARDAGIIIVAAAGNNGDNNDLIPNYPASYDLENIVSVCAITRFNTLDSGFSNYGATTVDIAAPGSSIYSTWFSSDRAYSYSSGTSMAAPFVSGAFALLKARYPADSASQLIARLLGGAEPVPALANKCVTGGRLNLATALGASLQAGFLPSSTVGEAPLAVTFANHSFGAVRQYLWDFGDGSEVATNPEPRHVFPEPGVYPVTLKVVGENGQAHSTAKSVRIVRNYEFAGEPFAWIDISSADPLPLADNGVTAPIEIGFPFEFYGQSRSLIHVAANGILGFDAEGLSSSSNTSLPNPAVRNALIAPYWDNLNPAAAGNVYAAVTGEAPRRKFVVSWVDVPKNSSGARLTFQAVLEEGSNEIVFQYLEVQPQSTRGGGRAATAGLQEGAGEVGALYTRDGLPFTLQNGQALRAKVLEYSYLTASPASPAPFSHFSGEALAAQERVLRLRNAGTISLEWSAASTNAWLMVAPAGGTLEPGAEATVTISLGQGAVALPTGAHPYSISVENLRDGQGNTFVASQLDVLVRSGVQAHASAAVESGTFKLSIEADPGTIQVIETSQDLVMWTPVQTNTIDAGGTFDAWFLTTQKAREFFRIRESR